MSKISFLSVAFISSFLVLSGCPKKKSSEESVAAPAPEATPTPTPTPVATPTPTPTPTPSAPTAGTAISFGSVTTTGMTVSWGAATDSNTSQASLQYKLVSSTSNNIDTAANALANGTLVMDWTANTTSKVVTGLSSETNYYYAVLIKNNANLTTHQGGSKSTLCSGKMIYRVTGRTGSLGGKSGADSVCNSNKPSGFTGTAKALLYVSAADPNGARVACSGADCTNSSSGQTDWPLAANANYCNTNYVATMGTTNANGYLNVTLANSLASSSGPTFTGMNGAMAAYTNNNCSDWTVWANPNQAAYGNAAGTGTNFISATGNYLCSGGAIYCVEQ